MRKLSSIASNTKFNGSAVSAGGGDFVVSGGGDTATTFTLPTFFASAGTTIAFDASLVSVDTEERLVP